MRDAQTFTLPHAIAELVKARNAVREHCYTDDPAMLDRPLVRQYLEYADQLGEDKYVALVAVAM